MTYFDLVSSHIKRNGGDGALVAAVADYLENAHPQGRPSWSQEFDDICRAAVAYANSKQERLRERKRVAKAKSPAPNRRHRQSLATERHAIRRTLDFLKGAPSPEFVAVCTCLVKKIVLRLAPNYSGC
jgi:hypothetical protein